LRDVELSLRDVEQRSSCLLQIEEHSGSQQKAFIRLGSMRRINNPEFVILQEKRHQSDHQSGTMVRYKKKGTQLLFYLMTRNFPKERTP
jgi:hypothetical protein